MYPKEYYCPILEGLICVQLKTTGIMVVMIQINLLAALLAGLFNMYLKCYLCYKTINSQNVPSKAPIKIGKLCSVFEIFKFLYSSPANILPNFRRHDEY